MATSYNSNRRNAKNGNHNNQSSQTSAPKERDLEQVVWYLNKMFNKVTAKLGLERANRDNKDGTFNRMYDLERELAYLIHEMQMCAPCVQQVYIAEANNLIDSLLKESRRI